MAFKAERRKYALPIPGTSTGYWNAMNRPFSGGFLRLHRQQIFSVEQDFSRGYFVRLAARQYLCQRALCPTRSGP